MENEKNTITLGDILHILLKNLFIIIPVTILCFIMGVIYTFKIKKPTYKTQGSVIVNVVTQDSSSSSTANNTNTSIRLLASVADIWLSNMVLDEVIKNNEELNKYTAKQLRSTLSTNYGETAYSSLLVTITCTTNNAELSETICNAVMAESIKQINEKDLIPCDVKQVDIAKKGSYVGPNKMLYMLISIVIGLVLGIAISFIKELMQNKVNLKNIESISNTNSYKILAEIPYIKEEK